MENIKEFLQNKELCDNNFLFYMNDKIEFINPKFIDFCGYYQQNGKNKIKVPRIINDYIRSIVVHELGHLYDYYTNGKIIDNEDNSLLWEFLYLEYSHNYQLFLERIQTIEKDMSSPHYKSLQKIKRS